MSADQVVSMSADQVTALPVTFLDDVGTEVPPPATPPEGLTCTLYSYQLSAIAFMVAREQQNTSTISGGILADEQGIGKTIMCAGCVAAHRWTPPAGHDPSFSLSALRHPCGATLIACTSTILQQWRNELAQHAPKLDTLVYGGQSEMSHASVQRDVRRLAQADVILVTYEVLTSELRGLEQSYESNRERRERIGLRARSSDREDRPSPLKYLDFWRVILDEVQKAPASYKAGRTVRMLSAKHRWACSGTPMADGKLEDVGHLINFIAGDDRSPAELQWWREVRAFRAGDTGAVARLQAALRPYFLRRTQAGVAHLISIPPQSVRRYTFELSMQERALQREFVLPAALRYMAKGRAAAEGPAEELASAETRTESGHGPEKVQQLLGHCQRSLLSPQLWSKWGQQSRRAVEAQTDGMRQRASAAGASAAGGAASSSALAAKGIGMELVGELAISRLTSGAPGAIWPSLVTAARAEADHALTRLRHAVEKHALGSGEVQLNDLIVVQQLMALKIIGAKGCVGPPCVPAGGDAPRSFEELGQAMAAPGSSGAEEARRLRSAWGGRLRTPVHGAAQLEAELAQRRDLTYRALDIVLRVDPPEGVGGLHFGVESMHGMGRFAAWACAPSNSDGVIRVLSRFLGHFNTSDAPWTQRLCGRPLVPIEDMRWAEVAPVLALRAELQDDTHDLERFRQNLKEMHSITGSGIGALGRASNATAAQYLYAIGSDLGDLFRERDDMRAFAERRLMPEAIMRRLHLTAAQSRFETRYLYHVR